MSVAGRCLCGGIRFQVELPTKWCAHCHCGLCRSAHGAAFVTWFGVDRARFRLLAGDDLLRWYPSSPGADRGFCARCGSTLLFRSERWPEEIHVALAHMVEAIDREPAGHVFFDSKAEWIEIRDALPRFGGASGTEPLERS